MTSWIRKWVISYAIFYSTVITGSSAQYGHPHRPLAPGVAFGLTPDYGVAAIHLKDGTSVPVARIQGSPSYQAFMRKDTTATPLGTENSTFCRVLSPALNRLPLEFGFDICRNAGVTATKSLLSALKKSVESYLGTNICFAGITLDNPEKNNAGVVQEALQALGLRQVLPTVLAAQFVVIAHEPENSPGFDEEPWIVLAVDYSSHWFNVGLYTIDEGLVDPIEGFVQNPTIGENNQLDVLGDALRHLFANPPNNVTLPEKIHHLIVYGDNKKEDVLNLLKTFMAADLVDDAIVSDSVFDAVTEIAGHVHGVMDTVEFEMRAKSAFGCQWRSALYRNEL